MFTKLISFVCVLTLALAATTYAVDDPLVIGNWENNFDDWQEMWGDCLYGFSTTGGTLDGLGGSADGTPKALKLLTNPGDWASAVYLKLQGHTNEDIDIFGIQTNRLEWFAENCQYNMLEIDVTRIAAEWVKIQDDPLFSELNALLNWGFADASGTLAAGWDMVGPGNSAWDGLADDTRTVMYDLTDVKAGFVAAYEEFYASGNYVITDAWCEIVLLPWNQGYAGVAGNANMLSYYLDNARLTPEPSTLALLGLGALSLIRRKR
jgi:hypothetical protein